MNLLEPSVHARADAATARSCLRARPLLGTLVELSVQGLSQQAANAAMDRAFGWVEQIHELMSFQSPDSELSRLNRHAAETPVAVSDATWAVLRMAREVSRVSGGLFDVTVAASLVHLGFLPRHGDACCESFAGNWRDVQLLPGQRVRFARPLCVDLSGIAKGYAVDRALESLRESGANGGCVNAGGDLRCFGEMPRSVEVRHPIMPGLLLPLLELQDGAAATSAHYFARRMRAGKWVSALIDPVRGKALTEDLSVTVLAPSCMLADALTKVVHADADRALDVLAHFGADALLLRCDPEHGECQVLDTRVATNSLAPAWGHACRVV